MNTLFLDFEFGPIYGSSRADQFPTEIGAVIYDVERHKVLFESKQFYYDVYVVIRKNIINDIGKTVGFSEIVANLKRGEDQKIFDPSYRLEKSDKVIARKLRSDCLDELRQYIHNLFKIHQVDQIVFFGAREDLKILKRAKVNISNIQVIDIQIIIEKEISNLFSLEKISFIIGFYAKDKCFGTKNFNYKLPLNYTNQMEPHRALGDACRIFMVCKEFCTFKSEFVQQCNMYCEINKISLKQSSSKFAGVDFSELPVEHLTPDLTISGQGFSCLRREFVTYWRQGRIQLEIDARISQCWILRSEDALAGYITLLADKLEVDEPILLDEGVENRSFPAIKIGLLAVDRRAKGADRRLVEWAVEYVAAEVSPTVGVRFMTVDALYDSDTTPIYSTSGFYEKFGFQFADPNESLPPSVPYRTMYLDLKPSINLLSIQDSELTED